MAVRGLQSDVQENFSQGVITAALPDRLPDGALFVAKNTQFRFVGPNVAVFGTRNGAQVQNDTVLGGAVLAQFFLTTAAGTTFHIVVLDNGDIGTLTAGVYAEIEAGRVTEPEDFGSWQTFDDWAYFVNGTDQFKTDGSDAFNFGIQQPEDGDWSVSAGGSGGSLPADTYDVAIGYMNSDTGHIGPTSEIKSVAVASGEKLTVTLPSAVDIDDAQVDYIRIYFRPRTIRTQLVFVSTGGTPAVTDELGWAVGTASVELDLTSSQITALLTLAPDVNEHYSPPATAKFIIAHKGRMFAATSRELYWSDVEKPEAFNTTDNRLVVGEDDGEAVTGLAVLGERLIVFKRNAIYALDGDDPQTWEIRLIDNTIGCVAAASIAYSNNKLFWMSLKGPQMWILGGGIIDITSQLVGPQFDGSHVNIDDLDSSIAISSPAEDYVGWAIKPIGASVNTLIIPFHTKLDRWMATEWNIVDVASACVITDSNGRKFPMIADHDGFVYQLGVQTSDGVPSGEDSNGSVTGSGNTTLTDSTATWTTNCFAGRYVYVWNTANGVRNAQRRKIVSNTATELTVSSAWTSNPGVGEQYQIGGILLDVRTGFRDGGGGFFKKRIEFAFLTIGVSDVGNNLEVEFYKDLDSENPIGDRQLSIGVASIWDDAVFDSDVFTLSGVKQFRLPIRRVGYNWQLRLSHMSSGDQLYVHRTGVQWQTKTKKPGRQPLE